MPALSQLGPGNWQMLRRLAAGPALSAGLWTAAMTLAGVAADHGDPAVRRQMRILRVLSTVVGVTAWLRTGFLAGRRYGLTMEEAGIAGGMAGAAAGLLTAMGAVGRQLARASHPARIERAIILVLLSPIYALAGYTTGAALAAIGAAIERRARA